MTEVSAWTFGWEALVAIGTIGLAAATFLLARTTRSLARLTRSEIEGTIRPLLVDVPPEEAPEVNINFRPIVEGGADLNAGARPGSIAERIEGPNTAYVGVPLRNVGPGTAVLATPYPSIFPAGGGAAYQGKVDALAIPPGGRAHALFRSNTVGAGGGFDPTQGNYKIEVAYRDAAGGQFTRTQLYVDPQKRVVGIAVFHGHHPTPYIYYGSTWEDWPALIGPELSFWQRFRIRLRRIPRVKFVRP